MPHTHIFRAFLVKSKFLALVLRSSAIIKYIFNRFLFSKRSLHKKLLNIYLIEVDERNNNVSKESIMNIESLSNRALW